MQATMYFHAEDFRDWIEDLALAGREHLIVFCTGQGGRVPLRDRFAGTETAEEGLVVRLRSGLRLRADQLLSVDDQPLHRVA